MKTVQELMNAMVAPSAVPVYGHKAVTTAGTQVALGTTASIPGGLVLVKALAANTGFIYVGGATVEAATGFELDAGEMVYWPATDLANVYVDSSVNGEGVCFMYS